MELVGILSKYYKIDCSEDDFDNVNLDYVSKYIDKNSNRYLHIKGVVEKMKETINKINGIDEETTKKLISISYLHDIGYSERLRKSEFHPLDGGIFAIEKGFDDVIIKSILFHTCAEKEAILIGGKVGMLYSELKETINDEDKFFIDMISYCDLHIDGLGKCITLEERIADILSRYDPESIVARNIRNNTLYFYELRENIERQFI